MNDRGVRDRVAAMLGTGVTMVDLIDRGHFANRRYRVTLDDGRSVFAKEPTTSFAQAVLDDERRAYESLAGRPFLPTLIASSASLLIVEDLSHAYWPPPWRQGDLEAALSLLDEIASQPGPPSFRDLADDNRHGVWQEVAADPTAFLQLGECTPAWLARSIDSLVETDACPLGGASLVHGDLRSDNLCVLGPTAIAVDWGAAARGRADYDLVGFAIATASERNVSPDDIAPAADPALVAVFAGTYAHATASPAVPESIRHQLRGFLHVALPWCARLLGLRPPT